MQNGVTRVRGGPCHGKAVNFLKQLVPEPGFGEGEVSNSRMGRGRGLLEVCEDTSYVRVQRRLHRWELGLTQVWGAPGGLCQDVGSLLTVSLLLFLIAFSLITNALLTRSREDFVMLNRP